MLARTQRLSGLTLVELLVVVVVLAVLATLAAPAYQSMLSARRLSGSAALLIADLHNARSQAVLRNTDLRVQFFPPASGACSPATAFCYRISRRNPVSTSTWDLVRQVDLPEEIAVTAGDSTTITYDPVRGSATASGTNAVTLAKSPHSLRLTIHPRGRVECTVLSGNASC